MAKIRKQTKLWTERSGRKKRICDMDDDHLINTLLMLERFAKAKVAAQVGEALFMPMPFPGTIAEEMVETAVEQFLEDVHWVNELPEITQALLLDAQRREIPFFMNWPQEEYYPHQFMFEMGLVNKVLETREKRALGKTCPLGVHEPGECGDPAMCYMEATSTPPGAMGGKDW